MMTTNLSNHFLVAMPSLHDSNFSKSVIFLYEHTEQGAFGMIVNKPHQIHLGNVLSHLKINCSHEEIIHRPVLLGGPVGQEHGFILYKNPRKSKSQNNIIVSASTELLKKISKNKGPSDFLVILGYAGWSEGQLEKEIAKNDWLIAPLDNSILFEVPLNERWQKTAKLIGVEIEKLTLHAGHA